MRAARQRGRADAARSHEALERAEPGQHAEVLPEPVDRLAHLIDSLLDDVSQKTPRLLEIPNLPWVDRHQPRRGGVDGDGIITEDECTTSPGLALDRPVALHAHDAVDDGKARHRQRAVDVEDALVDARPVQDVLRPAVDSARDAAKHVLE